MLIMFLLFLGIKAIIEIKSIKLNMIQYSIFIHEAKKLNIKFTVEPIT